MDEDEQLTQLDVIRHYMRLAEGELAAAEREIKRNGNMSEARYDFIQHYLTLADDALIPLHDSIYPSDEQEPSP